MKCRRRWEYEYLILNKDNAKECLDKIGFGEEHCKETYAEDKRYGIVCDDRIQYGFENYMHSEIKFGYYVVFNADCDDMYEDVRTEEEFFEEYVITHL